MSSDLKPSREIWKAGTLLLMKRIFIINKCCQHNFIPSDSRQVNKKVQGNDRLERSRRIDGKKSQKTIKLLTWGMGGCILLMKIIFIKSGAWYNERKRALVEGSVS